MTTLLKTFPAQNHLRTVHEIRIYESVCNENTTVFIL